MRFNVVYLFVVKKKINARLVSIKSTHSSGFMYRAFAIFPPKLNGKRSWEILFQYRKRIYRDFSDVITDLWGGLFEMYIILLLLLAYQNSEKTFTKDILKTHSVGGGLEYADCIP